MKEIGKIQALMIPGTVMPSPLKCWFRAPSQARLSSDDLISGDVAKQEREREVFHNATETEENEGVSGGPRQSSRERCHSQVQTAGGGPASE